MSLVLSQYFFQCKILCELWNWYHLKFHRYFCLQCFSVSLFEALKHNHGGRSNTNKPFCKLVTQRFFKQITLFYFLCDNKLKDVLSSLAECIFRFDVVAVVPANKNKIKSQKIKEELLMPLCYSFRDPVTELALAPTLTLRLQLHFQLPMSNLWNSVNIHI